MKAKAQSQVSALPKINPVNLEQILSMKETEKALKERLALIEKAIEEMEAEVISQIDGGANVKLLPFDLKVQETTRRYPSWKKEFEARLGKEEAEAVLEATEPTVTRKLVINPKIG